MTPTTNWIFSLNDYDLRTLWEDFDALMDRQLREEWPILDGVLFMQKSCQAWHRISGGDCSISLTNALDGLDLELDGLAGSIDRGIFDDQTAEGYLRRWRSMFELCYDPANNTEEAYNIEYNCTIYLEQVIHAWVRGEIIEKPQAQAQAQEDVQR